MSVAIINNKNLVIDTVTHIYDIVIGSVRIYAQVYIEQHLETANTYGVLIQSEAMHKQCAIFYQNQINSVAHFNNIMPRLDIA